MALRETRTSQSQSAFGKNVQKWIHLRHWLDHETKDINTTKRKRERVRRKKKSVLNEIYIRIFAKFGTVGHNNFFERRRRRQQQHLAKRRVVYKLATAMEQEDEIEKTRLMPPAAILCFCQNFKAHSSHSHSARIKPSAVRNAMALSSSETYCAG
jgi:hypothetical protein